MGPRQNASPTLNINNNNTYPGGQLYIFTHLPTISISDEKFDVILTSETIYNPDNYEILHDVILKLLAPHGVCYLAGKSVYFGVGGSMWAFREFVQSQNKLNVELCFSTTTGKRTFHHNDIYTQRRTILYRILTGLSSILDLEGHGCPSGYYAGLTNLTSLVRFPSPKRNFS